MPNASTPKSIRKMKNRLRELTVRGNRWSNLLEISHKSYLMKAKAVDGIELDSDDPVVVLGKLDFFAKNVQ